MAGKYDEDVYENPYFLKILSDHPEYLEKAVAFKGILCVPKYSIASTWTPSLSDIEDHVLLPTGEIVDDDDDYITVSKKIVHISDGKLCTKNGFAVARQAPVLFSETFHTDGGGSYRMLCIGGLLNQTVDVSEKDKSSKTLSPSSYRQCLELLWSHSGGHKMRGGLDKLLSNFAVAYDRLEGETLRSIVDVANMQFTKAMQLLLKDSVVRKSVQHNPYYMDNLKVAVETYVMNSIHKRLFRVITATMAGQDAEINKINRNLAHLQLSDLAIRQIFSRNIPSAKKELNLLNKYSTPVGRLFCLKRVIATLTRPPKSGSKESSKDTVAMMTTDDLLPILIFLIIKSEIPNWMANLVYMRHFHFAKSSDDDEFGFYLATLEAALEHIRSGYITDELKLLKRDQWNSLIVASDPGETSPPPSNPQSPSRQLSHSSIDDFFRFVQEGDEKRVQQMLERPYRTSEEVHLKLCHPLCSCDKCDKLLSDFRSNSDLVTAYTRDRRGYTALHIASYYGQAVLIDLLIQNNAVVDATDYLGLTPLHLACQRGFQNVMLLLLHFGADVVATDNEGNTPLHLSCANGHEDCVKALVFYEASMRRLQINVANEFGDTALHLAAKWGYEIIVKTLLENGADATLRNRKSKTPVALAQNAKVQRWLQLAAEEHEVQSSKSQQFMGSSASHRSRSASNASVTSQTSTYSNHRSGRLDLFEPENSSARFETSSLEAISESEVRRKKERLFKAVLEGDIQLVKFYLGAMSEADDGRDDDSQVPPMSLTVDDMCHPLCECKKCLLIQKAARNSGGNLSVNSKTSTGYYPIHMAVLHNHSDIVQLLISSGANVSVQNHKNLTPLHLAVCIRSILVTEMLVRAGARLNMHDINGDTPLLIAASNGFTEGVQALIKAGADLNVTNHKNNTALHEAVRRHNSGIATVLLKAGADPRIKNRHGRRPLDDCKDQSLRGMLVTAYIRLERAEKLMMSASSTSDKQDRRENDGQVSIKELFAAFEKNDLDKLQRLASSIRTFDRKTRLRRTRTKDKSSPFLGAMTQKHLISSFDRSTLRKTQSRFNNDPYNLYALSKSKSMSALPTQSRALTRQAPALSDASFSSQDSSFDETLTPMGDSFDQFSDFDESLTPMGDSSFDRTSEFDESLTPMEESSYNHPPNFGQLSFGDNSLDQSTVFEEPLTPVEENAKELTHESSCHQSPKLEEPLTHESSCHQSPKLEEPLTHESSCHQSPKLEEPLTHESSCHQSPKLEEPLTHESSCHQSPGRDVSPFSRPSVPESSNIARAHPSCDEAAAKNLTAGAKNLTAGAKNLTAGAKNLTAAATQENARRLSRNVPSEGSLTEDTTLLTSGPVQTDTEDLVNNSRDLEPVVLFVNSTPTDVLEPAVIFVNNTPTDELGSVGLSVNNTPTDELGSVGLSVNNTPTEAPTVLSVNNTPTDEPTVLSVNNTPTDEPTVLSVNNTPTDEPTVLSVNNTPTDELTVLSVNNTPTDEPTVLSVNNTPTDEPTVLSVNDTPTDEPTVLSINNTPTDELEQVGLSVNNTPTEELEPTVLSINNTPTDELVGLSVNNTPTDELGSVGLSVNNIPTEELEPTVLSVNNTPTEELEPTVLSVNNTPTEELEPTIFSVNNTPTDEPTVLSVNNTPTDEPTALSVNNTPTDEPTVLSVNNTPKDELEQVSLSINNTPKDELEQVGLSINNTPKDELEQVGLSINNTPKDELEQVGLSINNTPKDELEQVGLSINNTPKDELEQVSLSINNTPKDELEQVSLSINNTPKDELEQVSLSINNTPKDELEQVGLSINNTPKDELEQVSLSINNTPTDEPTVHSINNTPTDEPTVHSINKTPTDEPTVLSINNTPTDEPTVLSINNTPKDEPTALSINNTPKDELEPAETGLSCSSLALEPQVRHSVNTGHNHLENGFHNGSTMINPEHRSWIMAKNVQSCGHGTGEEVPDDTDKILEDRSPVQFYSNVATELSSPEHNPLSGGY